MKVLFRGGSIASGYGVDRSYIDIIKESPIFKSDTIINRSRHKDTTFDVLGTYQEDIFHYKPDILLLHFAIDDIYYPVYRSEFKENLVQIVRLTRKNMDSEVVLITSHPFDNRYEMGVLDIYYRTIREVSIDLNCHLIPVHIYWSGYVFENGFSNSQLLQQDYRYPNEQGQTVYADFVTQALIKLKG